MTDINVVVLVGRAVKDAELRYTKNGKAAASFSIAVNRAANGKDDAHFFDCTVWGKYAEAMVRHIAKGRQLSVTGRLEQQRWTQDGQTRSKVGIVVNDMELLGGKGQDGQQPKQPQESGDEYEEPFEDDDLPF